MNDTGLDTGVVCLELKNDHELALFRSHKASTGTCVRSALLCLNALCRSLLQIHWFPFESSSLMLFVLSARFFENLLNWFMPRNVLPFCQILWWRWVCNCLKLYNVILDGTGGHSVTGLALNLHFAGWSVTPASNDAYEQLLAPHRVRPGFSRGARRHLCCICRPLFPPASDSCWNFFQPELIHFE